MKTIFFIFLMALILNNQIKSQDYEWNQKRALAGGALSYQRGGTGLDYFYLGVQIPLLDKIHTGLSYGYFSRGVINTHQVGTTLGYDIFTSQLGRLYAKTDLSFFYRQHTSKFINPIDDKFFRHSFGLGYLIPIYKRLIFDVQSNFFGFFYGRNEPYKGTFKIYEASEVKIGIGYGF